MTNKLFISFLSIILSNGVFASLPNDPHLSKQWYLESHLKMFTTWESYDPQKEIVVAVLDSGIDLTHDDLKKRLWVNKAEEHGLPNVDDDKNGFVDDIHGYNFISKNPNVQDDLGHGTQCAGIIAAEVNNGIGIVGIAPSHVKVMAVKTIGKAGIFNLESAVAGIYYAVDNGAKVINASWNTPTEYSSLKRAIEYARDHNVIIVNSAGNEGLSLVDDPQFPALFNLENQINVANLDKDFFLSLLSNFGMDTVHVAAPGSDIFTTDLGNNYKHVSGTSFASPIVSAVVAMQWAQNPKMSFEQIKSILLNGVTPFDQLASKLITGGALNPLNALRSIHHNNDPENPRNWNQLNLKIETKHPYLDNTMQTWTIAPIGAREMVLHFSRFQTSVRDTLEILNSQGEVLQTIDNRYETPIQSVVLPGAVTLKFSSDHSLNAFGFVIDNISWR